MTSTTKIILAIMAGCAAVLVWCAVVADGQEADLIPPMVAPNAALDTSALSLPTDPQPTTVTLIWGNPNWNSPYVVNSNCFAVVSMTLDCSNWIKIDEIASSSNGIVTITNSNHFAFYRVGYQIGF